MNNLHKKTAIILIFFLFFIYPAFSQLFEEAEETLENGLFDFELNGVIRSMIYAGMAENEDALEIKKGAGEINLKAGVTKQEWGKAYADFLIQGGYEFGQVISSNIILKEAYVSLFYGPLDVIMGQQIVPWGKADAFNPTDNITPKNLFSLSTDLDDRRIGNFLLRVFLNLQPLRIEGIWIPFYKASIISDRVFSFPSNLEIKDPWLPDEKVVTSSAALKTHLEIPSFEASVSYFNGFYLQPGIEILDISLPRVIIRPRAFLTHSIGTDFSTTLGNIMGIRGEAAYLIPYEQENDEICIPNPEIRYVFGLDKTFFSELTVILQYMGGYVFDFSENEDPLSPESVIGDMNSMFFSQTDEFLHSFFTRVSWITLYETLEIDLMGLYNITTEEMLFNAHLGYDIADAFTVSLGVNIFAGDSDTLFGMIDKAMSCGYAELKISF